MAQLKDTVVQGGLRVTDTTITTNAVITNTTAPTIANNDYLLIADASDGNKIVKGPVFDGSTTNQALTKKGTWASFTNNGGTVTSITIKTTSPITGGSNTATTSSGTYTIAHDSGDGNKHVPANGTGNNGKYLQATATAGTYQWASLPAATTSVAGITKVGASGGAAAYSHGNHVPTTETANNAKFLRNDNTWQTVTPANIGAAAASHGNHVPTIETANNAKFLRNDNTWQTVTPANIGAAATSHTHSLIVTAGDNRSTATTPNDYSNKIIFQGLKTNSNINSPSTDTYSYLVGLRGWSDSSGGDSHELAFNNTGIYWRHGATTTWGDWFKLNYVHPTSDGNKHIPANGTTNNGKFLQATATAGSYQWVSLPGATTSVAGITLVGVSGGAAAYSHNHAAGDINSGTLPVTRGGTGITTASYKNAVLTGNSTTVTSAFNVVRTANGAFFSTAQDAAPSFGTLPIAQGGTGSTSAAGAWTALGGGASGKHADSYFALASHGNHVPTTETANNAKFLRNDNTWQTVTPANIGAAASSHNHAAGDITSGVLATARIPTLNIPLAATYNLAENAWKQFIVQTDNKIPFSGTVRIRTYNSSNTAINQQIDFHFISRNNSIILYGVDSTRTTWSGNSGIYQLRGYATKEDGNNSTYTSYKGGLDLLINSTTTRTIEIYPLELKNCTVNNSLVATTYNSTYHNIATYNTMANQYWGPSFAGQAGSALYSYGAGANTATRTNGATLPLTGYGLYGLDETGKTQGISIKTTGQSANSTDASTTRVYNTHGIDWTKGIFYTNSGTWYAVNANTSFNACASYYAIDFRYTDNCVNSNSTLGLVARKPIYLRGYIKEDNLFYLDPVSVTYSSATYKRAWTQDVPTSATYVNGYQHVYMFLGYSYSTSYYQLELSINNPIYWFKDGQFKLYDKDVSDTLKGNTIMPIYVGDYLEEWNYLPSCCLKQGDYFYTFNSPLSSYAEANLTNTGNIRKFDIPNNIELTSSKVTRALGHGNSCACDGTYIYVAPLYDYTQSNRPSVQYLYKFNMSLVAQTNETIPTTAMGVTYDPVAQKLYYIDYSRNIYVKNGSTWTLDTTVDLTGISENEMISGRSYNQDIAIYNGRYYIISPYRNMLSGILTHGTSVPDKGYSIANCDSSLRWYLGETEGIEFDANGHLFYVDYCNIISDDLRNAFIMELPVGEQFSNSSPYGRGEGNGYTDGTLYLTAANQTAFSLKTHQIRSLAQMEIRMVRYNSSLIQIPEGNTITDDHVIRINDRIKLEIGGQLTVKNFSILSGKLNIGAMTSDTGTPSLICTNSSYAPFRVLRSGDLTFGGQYAMRISTPNRTSNAALIDVGYDYGMTIARRVPIRHQGNNFTVGGNNMQGGTVYLGTSYAIMEGITATTSRYGCTRLGTTSTDAAAGNHTHGNLTNDGKITSTSTIANGDKLVIVDSDSTAASKITGSSITFDGSTETECLTKKGTWKAFNNYSHPTTAGNKHIPTGGSAGNFLTYGDSSGTASWSDVVVPIGVITLWTNNSPTSNFAAQTLTNTNTNLIGKTILYVIVDFWTKASDGSHAGSVIIHYAGSNSSTSDAYFGTSERLGFTTGAYVYGRVINLTASGNQFLFKHTTGYWSINFGAGYRSNTSGNGYCIPYRIKAVYLNHAINETIGEEENFEEL